MPRSRPVRTSLLPMVTLLTLLASLHTPAMEERDEQIIGEFLLLLVGSPEGKREALAFVDDHWQKGFTPMLIEVLTFNRDPAFGPQLVELLQARTGQANGYDIRGWQRWLFAGFAVAVSAVLVEVGAVAGIVTSWARKHLATSDRGYANMLALRDPEPCGDLWCYRWGGETMISTEPGASGENLFEMTSRCSCVHFLCLLGNHEPCV